MNPAFVYRVFDGQFQFMLIPIQNGTIGNGDAVELVKTNFVFGVDTWYHIAFNYDGTQAKIYIDGLLNAQSNFVATLFPYVNRLYLGGGDLGRSFPGLIDELRFSEELRTGTDILSYYNSTK